MFEPHVLPHRYVAWTDPADPDAQEECRVCGGPGDPLRPGLHREEIAPQPRAEPDARPLLDYLVELVRAELADTQVALLDSQLDILARRAAGALYLRGAIRPRRSDWRPPTGHAA
ncbi:hypothetical protein [Nonomuraea zeae]|uniref:Uncharacterized protein n=1 Tax=Nonomuraea zeae TaxID=1642303 RepID=A0A5S4G3H2_9ACTN|nr:hypothetical protein [Nonomuraea zeae]TMR27543.1 hypothetical protein ETD85_38735 [Nonomuraea zeae]